MGNETATAAAEDELTEFEEIAVESVKGVPTGANGFPHLIMKGLPGEAPEDGGQDEGDAEKSAADLAAAAVAKAVTDGQVDEKPDVALGQQIMALLGQAIGNEAQEISAGNYGEIGDVKMLARAGDVLSTWCARERAVADGQDPDAPCGCCPYCSGMGCGCCPGCGYGAVMCSAADDAAKSSAEINDLPDDKFGYIEPGGKKDSDGKTTPRSLRHFPLHDEKHVRLAVQMLSTSPFGDEAKSKVMAAAKKHGIETDGDAEKSTVADGGTDVQTEPEGTGGLAKAVEDALTKALGPLKERMEALGRDVAKVMAAPVPGGPVLSAVRGSTRPAGNEDLLAKAAYYREKAETVTDPADRAGYRQLARETEAKAQAATA